MEKNPAVKLLEFNQGMINDGNLVRLDTKEIKAVSGSVRSLGSVGQSWMKLRLEQWSFRMGSCHFI
jgi:hypothetical protein